MLSSNSSIDLYPSTKPYYSEHSDLIRLRIELKLLSPNNYISSSPSLSSIFFDQIYSSPSSQYSINNRNELSKLIISYGYIYLLKYNEEYFLQNSYPKLLNNLIRNHFLPPLFDTFLPSTILEKIEITKENHFYLQQIFYQSNHTIKREVNQIKFSSFFSLLDPFVFCFFSLLN